MNQGVQFKQAKPWRYLFASFHFEEWLQGFALKGLVSVKKPYIVNCYQTSLRQLPEWRNTVGI